MEKRLEIVTDKGNTSNRLTVTPERVTMKFRVGASVEEIECVKKFFFFVAEALSTKAQSYRGKLIKSHGREGRCLVMLDNSQKDKEIFPITLDVLAFIEPLAV